MKKIKNVKILRLILLILCPFSTNALFATATFAESSVGAEVAEKVHRYNVKGVIVRLPKVDTDKPEIFIKHEEIPDYVGSKGDVVGMNAMTMPFYLGEGVSVGELKVQDKVEFIFESWWKPKPGDRIVEIKKVEDSGD